MSAGSVVDGKTGGAEGVGVGDGTATTTEDELLMLSAEPIEFVAVSVTTM